LRTRCACSSSPGVYQAFKLGRCGSIIPSCSRLSRAVAARPVSNPVSIGGSGPVGRGRLRRSGPPRPGTDRPAGHGKADASLTHPTPCSQSQIGQDRYLLWQQTAQVEAASGLSVVVRWVPVRTAVTGTLVARPVRTTWYSLAPLAPTWGVGGGPSSSTNRYVAKPRRRRGSSRVTSSL
jgi:hypothetical protein